MPEKIVLLEGIHPIAKQKLQDCGFDVEIIPRALSEAELVSGLANTSYLGIRSKTQISRRAIEANPNLKAIGCFCIGTNQVDLNAAGELGVPVFNAPHSNTRSVAELVIAEMIALSRKLCDLSRAVHEGRWLKSAEGSFEIRGKSLGIIGYGHIGSQVSILAENLGLRVYFYDIVKKLPLGNASRTGSLRELLEVSDFVTLHVPETSQTQNLMSAEELRWMKQGSFLLNLSRGTVVVLEDLAEALRGKHLAGAALDVFPSEPASNKEKFSSVLQGLDNVILTPHVGGSTEEAQVAIGAEVAESFIHFQEAGTTLGAVNFPQVHLPTTNHSTRILNIHRNEPGVLGEINSVISRLGANIVGQTLATETKIGYLVTDVEGTPHANLTREIAHLNRSIRTWSPR